jgi:hypothetical protein
LVADYPGPIHNLGKRGRRKPFPHSGSQYSAISALIQGFRPRSGFTTGRAPRFQQFKGIVNLSKLEQFEYITLASKPLKVRNAGRPETGTKHAKAVKLTMPLVDDAAPCTAEQSQTSTERGSCSPHDHYTNCAGATFRMQLQTVSARACTCRRSSEPETAMVRPAQVWIEVQPQWE